ncbi:MAG: CDP-alcohol phosphatidyltransferase [Chryseobacterium sp.]|nr:MAG: CDP-alcohol phosphatidyltransferase [Chryseobacterium sp.]
MNFLRNNLANLLTLGNLFLGCVAAAFLFNGDYKTAALMILGSLLLDFFDGFVARALKADSDLGGQLDSLADMVSFGFVPGLVMYKALEPFGNYVGSVGLPFDLKYIGFIVAVFSGLRLAIFNLDTEQTYYFKGLNTPSNTMLLLGLYYSWQEYGAFRFLFDNALLLILLALVCSWLLVSPIKMIALKFRSRKLADNWPKIILAIGALLLVAVLGIVGIPMAILFYILISALFQKQLK